MKVVAKPGFKLVTLVSAVRSTTHCAIEPILSTIIQSNCVSVWIRRALLFACWVILHAFLLIADFFKMNFFKKIFLEYHPGVKQFGSRSGPTIVGPDLDPNCLQRLSVDNSRH